MVVQTCMGVPRQVGHEQEGIEMIASTPILCAAAKEAGIDVPKGVDFDGDNLSSFRESHPHFFVYVTLQLGAPMPSAAAHWDNAKVIAAIPDDRITKVTVKELKELGFAFGSSLT